MFCDDGDWHGARSRYSRRVCLAALRTDQLPLSARHRRPPREVECSRQESPAGESEVRSRVSRSQRPGRPRGRRVGDGDASSQSREWLKCGDGRRPVVRVTMGLRCQSRSQCRLDYRRSLQQLKVGETGLCPKAPTATGASWLAGGGGTVGKVGWCECVCLPKVCVGATKKRSVAAGNVF